MARLKKLIINKSTRKKQQIRKIYRFARKKDFEFKDTSKIFKLSTKIKDAVENITVFLKKKELESVGLKKVF